MLVVRDLARDPRFPNNPFVKERGFRFYAGVPLHGPNGSLSEALHHRHETARTLRARAGAAQDDC